MMHCTMDDLGALQAGEGSVWSGVVPELVPAGQLALAQASGMQRLSVLSQTKPPGQGNSPAMQGVAHEP